MKLRTSVIITTHELESLLYGYVTNEFSKGPIPRADSSRNAVAPHADDVSCQLRFDDDVQGAIVDIYTADPITDHDDREGL